MKRWNSVPGSGNSMCKGVGEGWGRTFEELKRFSCDWSIALARGLAQRKGLDQIRDFRPCFKNLDGEMVYIF